MPVITRARARRAVVLTSVAAVALAGCGDQASQSPGQRVKSATSSVLDTEQLTVSIGLELDDASRDAVVEQVAEDQSESGPRGQQMSPAAVERLLAARIVTTWATTDGTKLSEADLSGADVTSAQPANVSSSVSLVIDGASLVELRQVSGVLYARADVAGLETALETPGLADGLESATAGAPAALADAAGALASGGWVSVDTTELATQLEGLAGEMGQSPTPSASPDADAVAGAVRTFLDDAEAVLTREVEVTENGEDAYTVTAPLDRILSGFAPSLKTVVTELAAQGGVPLAGFDAKFDAGVADAQGELAGREAIVEVALDGERLSTVRMDLAQFLEEQDRAEMTADGVTGLPVVVELSQDGEVEVPQDAVALDVAQVLEQVLGGLRAAGAEGDLGPADPFAGVTAEDLGMTQEEFEAFKAESSLNGQP